MPKNRNPFSAIRWTSFFTITFGILSVIIGITEMCVWLAELGVFGNISVDGVNRIGATHAGLSGAALVLMGSCGLWCGLWVLCSGACGCSIRLGQPSNKNQRTKIVVCLASGFNAVIFCPIQIALYAYMFTPEAVWFERLGKEQIPVWWALALQSAGIACGVASLILCIVSIVVALRIRPYDGQERTWDDLEI